MWYHDDLSWGGWILMTLGMLGFWALLVWLVVYLVRPTNPDDSRSATTSRSPEETLGDRYARGEIDESEFIRRRNVLRSGSTGDNPQSNKQVLVETSRTSR